MKIPLNASTFGEDEISAAIDVLRSGFVTFGERCLTFEAKFAEYIGSRHAIFVNSGSSANLLAFFALVNFECPRSKWGRGKLEPGQEVIVPAVTWSTTVWPIVQAGLVPVLVDSDPYSLQMNLESIDQAISDKTGAICPVHVLGNAVPFEGIAQKAQEHQLWVIEDTCESLGTRYDKKFVGTRGDMGTYSFFFSHHITTIEGGMIVTDNDDLAELLRCLRAHGWTRHLKNREQVEKKYSHIDPRFLFVNSGFNVRPTEINAAFGMKQLEKLENFNQRRVEVAGF
ncbi:MAG: DegT/DnrJ/EryC1/StrS family aminotransferase, partial [Bdellovibrionales bacterium]|nr:DegT/DnrJ/EryC1/StrS family aminotransferase [Bdellovibrionales bacterium]